MDRAANTIYMTDKFFSIFNSEVDVASVTVEKFKKIMTDYEPYRQQVEKDVFVYKLPVNNEFFPFRYIKLTIMDDGERCIGLAEDITQRNG